MKIITKISSGVIFVFSLIWLTPLFLQSQVVSERENLKLMGDGTSGPFFISEQYILVNTEVVCKDSMVLERDKDYTIDFNKGILWLKEPLEKNGSLNISFEKFSSGIKKRYYHRELSLSEDISSSNVLLSSKDKSISQKVNYVFKNPVSLMKEGKSFSPDLQISGSKSFSLDLGNTDAFTLSQGLDLKVSGGISKEVKVIAMLSDRGSRETQSGSTKKLEELDKVLMQVNSPHFNGFLGDQYLSFEGALSGRYDKKLQGATSEINFNQNRLSMSYASSKGRYGYNSFSGTEGKQGPYYLKGEDGRRGIQILPGTEKVYVDGKVLERGSDNDYTIDYSRGVLNFSSTCLVSGDSRIKVEFEYTDENYRKSFYSSQGEINLYEGKLKLKGLFLDEREDKGNPLLTSLSTEDKAILKSSGEDRDKAFKDGGQYVGTAKGDYVILIDTLGNPYYQYTGRDSGDYLVSFSWSGDSRGSYAYKGGGIYSYVYPGNGDYLPRIDLPLPSGHSILDLCLNLIPFDGFSSEIGWGLSRKDNNLFSGLDEGDNSGKAFFLKAGYEKQSPSIMDYTLSEIKLEGLYRSTGQNFSPFGRLDEVERERVWGMLNDSTKSPEDVFRFKGLVAPRENLVLNTDLGMMKKGAYFESSRNRFEIIYSPFKSLKAKVSSEDVNSTTREESANLRGNWQRDIFHLTHRWRKLNTEIGWEREEQKFTPEDSAKTGSRFDEFKGKINLKSNTLWDLSSLFIFREEKQKDVVWKKESFSYTWQNGLSLRNYKEVLSSRIEHIHRQKSFKTGENSKGDIGNFKLDYQSRNQALVLNLYYSANLSGAEKRIDNYLEVGEGRGDYRYENGEYIPDSEGSFILQQEILDDYIPGKKLDRSFRTVFKPGKLFPHIIFLKEFYSESIVKTSNLVVKEVDWTSFIFNPLNKGFGGDEQFRDFSSRHDFYLFPSAPLNLRLRWVEEERENLLLLTGKDKDFKKGQSILLRYRFSHNNSIESELLNDERERFKIDSNLLILKGKSIRVDFTRREGNSLEMTLSGRARKEKNEKSEITANIFELSPRLSYSLLNKGKIRSVFSWCRVTSSPQNSILPWEMAEGKKAGDNFGWRFGFDFGLNQTISAIFDYTGSKEPVRGTRHNGKIEVRASF